MKNEDMPAASLTKRKHACIALRVPETGDPELDALIREARRMDFAQAAMQALMQNPNPQLKGFSMVELARIKADALLAELEPKP